MMVQETERLTWNQFQKELRNRGIDGQVAYMLSMMYERQLDMSRQLDMCATLLMQFADTVKGFVDLHATTLERVDRLRKDIGGGSGVDVMSVANDPEKSH